MVKWICAYIRWLVQPVLSGRPSITTSYNLFTESSVIIKMLSPRSKLPHHINCFSPLKTFIVNLTRLSQIQSCEVAHHKKAHTCKTLINEQRRDLFWLLPFETGKLSAWGAMAVPGVVAAFANTALPAKGRYAGIMQCAQTPSFAVKSLACGNIADDMICRLLQRFWLFWNQFY